MTELRHTRLARRDLIEIWATIAQNNEAAADRVFARLEARVMPLAEFPELGQARPDIDATARVLVEQPYLILYRILPEAVQIVRVVHGMRHIDANLFQERIERTRSPHITLY